MTKKKYEKKNDKKNNVSKKNTNYANNKKKKNNTINKPIVTEVVTENVVEINNNDTIEVLDTTIEEVKSEVKTDVTTEVVVEKKKKGSILKVVFFIFWILLTIALAVGVGYYSYKSLEKQYYEVEFETGEEDEIPTQKVLKGEKAIEPKDPEKKGHIFSGWVLDDELYDFDDEVDSDITLEATWEEAEPEEYEFLPVHIHCYDKKAYDKGRFKLVENGSVGDQVVCTVGFETYGDDDVEELKFDLVYNDSLQFLEIIDDYNLDEIEDSTYTYIYDDPMPVNEAGMYAFEIIGDTDALIELENIELLINGYKYVTEVSEYEIDVNEVELEDVVEFEPYVSDSFSLQCYEKSSVDANNFKPVKSVKKGDKMVCYVGYETYAKDQVSSVIYDLELGKGLKLIDENLYSMGEGTDLHYSFKFEPTSVNDMSEYVIEVVDINNIDELFVQVSNIKFKTTNNKYFSNEDAKLKFSLDN